MARSHPLCVLLVAGAALALAGCDRQQAQSTVRADRTTVTRGRLEVTFKEAANIAALRETTVKSEVEGQATLIYLIPEGTQVKQGEKLAEIDVSSLLERRATQEISKARAEAGLVQAQKELEILIKQNHADEEAARNAVDFARMDLEKFRGRETLNGAADANADAPEGQGDDATSRQMGERQQELEAADSDIKLADAELRVAADRLEWSRKLHAKGYITKNELERDELDHERRKTAVTLARNRKDLLIAFTHVKTEKELEQKVDFAALELERVRARAEAKLAQANANVQSAEAELRLAKERFDNLVRQIENAVIKAPTPGLVVYATQGGGGGGMRDAPIEEGATVRERQSIIILPDITQMRADLKVHESFVDKVRAGQKALVRVDALPDQTFTGTIRRVSPLPDSGSRWSNPDLKVYKTEVVIDGENTVLRPGMSAQVTVLIGTLEDVLKVPIAAIHRKGDIQYCWRDTPQGIKAVPVQVGASNLVEVQIQSGLEAGDLVYLVPPAGVAAPDFPGLEHAAPKPPVVPADTDLAATPPSPAGVPTGANGEAPGQTPGTERRGRGSSPEMTAFVELIKQKRPDLAAKLEGGGMALMRDEEVRAAIEEDPDLKAKRDEMMQAMRARMGNRGDRQGREGRGNGAPRPGGGDGEERGR